MSLLLESICLNNGVLRNLKYHEERMRKSSEALKTRCDIDLSILEKESFPPVGLFKVRIVYDSRIRNVEILPYKIRQVKSLKIVYSDDINYDHKFLDRKTLESLFALRGASDDILIVKNGLITDSSYANVLFKHDENWVTPKSYLLNGTMRRSLIDQRLIKEAEITVENYHQYQCCKLVNSMLGIDGPEISTKSIF